MGLKELATANLSALGLSLPQIEAELRAKRANHDWLVAHKQALREDYPDRYVAVLNGKVVADERDIDSLFRRLRAKLKDVDLRTIAVDLVTAGDVIWIL
jgi:hypothetical protein